MTYFQQQCYMLGICLIDYKPWVIIRETMDLAFYVHFELQYSVTEVHGPLGSWYLTENHYFSIRLLTLQSSLIHVLT